MVITIIQQPTDYVANVGSNAIFSVEAIGDGLTYQWEWRLNDTKSWGATSNPGNKTSCLTVVANIGRNGYQYRCVITDSSGNTIESDAAVLTVDARGGKGLVPASVMSDIADAIRAKTATTDRILPPDMAAMIEGIETGSALPSWITEMEFVQVTAPSGVYTNNEVPSLSVPCGMSEAPVNHVMWVVYDSSSSSRTMWVSAEVSMVFADQYGDIHLQANAGWNDEEFRETSEAGKWTLSGGVATLTQPTYKYAGGYTYNIIMWR